MMSTCDIVTTGVGSAKGFSNCKCVPVGRFGYVHPDIAMAIKCALPMASTDTTRDVVNAVVWARLDEQTHMIAATDTYRLYVERVVAYVDESTIAPEVGTYWLLPGEVLRHAYSTKSLRNEGSMRIAPPTTDSKVKFSFSNEYVFGRKQVAYTQAAHYLVVTGCLARSTDPRIVPAVNRVHTYPNIERIIPEGPFAWTGEFGDIDRLSSILKRLVAATNDANRVRVAADTRLLLQAYDADIRARAIVCPNHATGSGKVAFNGMFLCEFLDNLVWRHGDNATVEWCIQDDPLSPIVLVDMLSGALYVQMPMRYEG